MAHKSIAKVFGIDALRTQWAVKAVVISEV
jgi:hypothetical protein